MTQNQQILWDKIRNYAIGPQNVALSFTDRLARENDWPISFAIRAVHEYKKFIFLICISGVPCTPSDEVDQVWHLHLLYTQDYWDDFCEKILGRKVHHGPTKGGQQQGQHFRELYVNTLRHYRETFETEPPADLWPEPKIRFGRTNFVRTSRDDFFVIPKNLKTLKKWFRSKN